MFCFIRAFPKLQSDMVEMQLSWVLISGSLKWSSQDGGTEVLLVLLTLVSPEFGKNLRMCQFMFFGLKL